MQNQAEPLRLGEFLVKAGVVTTETLEQRLGLAKQLGMPLGQILVQSKDISKENLLKAVQLQSMMMENLMTEEQAMTALSRMCKENLEYETVMEELGLSEVTLSHRLGELLIAAGHITEEDLAFALMTSAEIAVPLGHVLVQTGVVAPDVIGVALMSQRQVRMNILSAEEGVERIKVQCPTSSTTRNIS